jgi:hypothetical protein
MIMHNRECSDIHGEDGSQVFHTRFHPVAPVFVAFAAIIIHTAQKGAAHTARYYVVPFGFGQIANIK